MLRLLWFNVVNQQESHAVARKPRDAACISTPDLFLESRDDIRLADQYHFATR